MSNSKWGANAGTIRTTALLLSFSVAEYTVPVWTRWPHAQKLNTERNSACRTVTGCLNQPTNVVDLYLLAGIAPPDIRRDVCARVENTKQEISEVHSLYVQHAAMRKAEVQELLLAYCKTMPASLIRSYGVMNVLGDYKQHHTKLLST